MLVDSQKIIGPSLSFCTTTSVVAILIMSFFVVLLVAIDIYPLPDWSSFVAEWSGNLARFVLGDRIE
jgi:hypothetical protein